MQVNPCNIYKSPQQGPPPLRSPCLNFLTHMSSCECFSAFKQPWEHIFSLIIMWSLHIIFWYIIDIFWWNAIINQERPVLQTAFKTKFNNLYLIFFKSVKIWWPCSILWATHPISFQDNFSTTSTQQLHIQTSAFLLLYNKSNEDFLLSTLTEICKKHKLMVHKYFSWKLKEL